jgi:predicted TIM-barrel fold metal-dependent hydrolase
MNTRHMTRRRFVGSLSASAALIAGPRRPSLGVTRDENRLPVVDTHMHVWSHDAERFPFRHPYNPRFEPPPIRGSVEMLLSDMDAHGVTHAILVQVIYHGWDNRYVAHCVRAHPDRFRAHGLIDPTDPHVADKLTEWVAEHGLSGMRFSPIYYRGRDEWVDSQSSRALWQKAAELDAVFNFFIAPEQLPRLQVMIERFPEVQVVIDHLGQMDLAVDDPGPQLARLVALARYTNAWVKVSELSSVSKSKQYPFPDAYAWVERVYDAFGPDRLLWGTGYPGAARADFQRPTLQEELDLIREKIPFFTAEDRRKILGLNAARLWKLA